MYQALYRKYRPIDFDSVVGQSVIVKTLKNSIANNSFSHAYMFFGPRGTGKTTVSKIFARNINCLNSKDGLACGKCSACVTSFSKDCIDIIEIDAASNNGVDEIRELKNKISLVPSELKYKVYIIDEVHMLSIGAFNALLKTLEEPPEHAVFILATTDPQKVPETIVSRCQCFSFNRISSDAIVEKLTEVCKLEKIKVDSEVLDNIAVLSAGGMRDALGMLDKLSSYTNDKITMSVLIEVNAILSEMELSDFLKAILGADISSVLTYINVFDADGKNLVQVFTQLLYYIRKILVDYYLSNKKTLFSIDLLQKLANIINENMFDIKKSDNVRIYIEMFLLKFIGENINNTENSVDVDNKTVNNIEISTVINDSKVPDMVLTSEKEKVDNLIVDEDSSTFNGFKVLNVDEIMAIRVNNVLAKADKILLKEEIKKFELLKDYTFDQEIGYIVCSLLDCKVRAVSSEAFIISFDYDSNVKQNLAILDKLSDVYNKITNSNKLIAIVSDEKWEQIKIDYINNIKNKVKYEIKEEPEVIFEESDKNDIISNDAINLFGDIVEVE